MKIAKKDWINFWNAIDNKEWAIEEGEFPELEDADLPEVFDGDGTLGYCGSDRYNYSSPYIKKNEVEEGYVSFKSAFKRFLKDRSTITICIEIPKEKETEFISAIEAMGYKVSK